MTEANDTQLRQLQIGDRVTYHGVTWQVTSFNSYAEQDGGAVDEWCLTSTSRKEYYLLYEVEPEQPAAWYLAEEMRDPKIYDPQTNREVMVHLGQAMRQHQEPYPTLQVYQRTYQFDSQTEGRYTDTDGTSRLRITWDYWDAPRLWNLAFEAWEDGTLAVYQTRSIQPTDFQVEPKSSRRSFTTPASWDAQERIRRQQQQKESRKSQTAIAWVLVVVGFIFMMMGI